jgi:DNA-binding SARP family transcriptional activator
MVPPATSPLNAVGNGGASPLRIRLLGELQVARGGEILPLPASRRTRALLGYLAATNTPHLRQSLCDLLWDGPDDPRAALRWSLSKLRDVVNAPDAERLKADREHVAFDLIGVDLDAAGVAVLTKTPAQTAGIDALEVAAATLQGEFLDGLDLPGCPRFHQWCMTERERYGAIRRAVLRALVAACRDDPPRALAHARALVAADPLSEAAHADLIRLLAECGRTHDAEVHCEHAAEMLRREVGGRAAETLRAALRAARSRRAAAATEAGPAPVPPPPELPQQPATPRATGLAALVGRDAEYQYLVRAAAALAEPVPQRPLLVLGDPGLGKTRLLQALAEEAAARGALVASARCYDAELIRPLGCVLDAMGGLPDGVVPEDGCAEIFMGLHTAALGSVATGDRERLLARTAAFFREIAARQPLVLILDDLQWVDEASAALLHYLVRCRIPRFLLAGSARSGEIDDNCWAKRLFQSLSRDGTLDRLEPQPLTEAETAALAGLPPGSEAAACAYRSSGGNPLLITEIAHAREAAGSGTGRTLDALVADRLERLPNEERDAVVWAAALGRAFSAELLAACLGQPEAQVFARLDRLARHGLLRPTENGGFDFAHDLVREGVYRLQSQPYRRFLHRQIGRALACAAEDDPRLYGDLVHHAGMAEDHALAVRACIATTEQCLRLCANPQAEQTALRGLRHLADMPPGHERLRQQIRLLELRTIASAGARLQDHAALIEELEQASDAAALAGLYAEATAALHAVSWLCVNSNDIARTQDATLRAERISRTADIATRCQQMANTGRCLLEVEAEIPRAMALVDEAAAAADTHNLHIVELAWGRALAARWRGDLADAEANLRRAISLARAGEDHRREMECLIWLAMIALERRDCAAAERACAEIDSVIHRMRGISAPAAMAFRAFARIVACAPGAEAELLEGLAALRGIDDKARLAFALNTWAMLARDRGEDEPAAAAAAEALSLATILRRPTEAAVAASLLAELAEDGDRAAAYLAEARAARDRGIAARGLACLARAEAALRVSTVVQTVGG